MLYIWDFIMYCILRLWILKEKFDLIEIFDLDVQIKTESRSGYKSKMPLTFSFSNVNMIKIGKKKVDIYEIISCIVSLD